jgi:hypothetical protein
MTQTNDPLSMMQAAARVRELAELKERMPWLFWHPHEAGQLQFHRSPHIIRALFPGNGFGKTSAMGCEFAWWLFKRHPYFQIPKWPLITIWAAETYKQFELLRAQLESECLGPERSARHPLGWRFNKTDHVYTFGDGSKFFLISGDGSWTHIQGINPDLVGFDEEPPAKLWNEMKVRRRGVRKTRFCFAATATQGLTWMYEQLYLPWLKLHTDSGLTELEAMKAQKHPLIWCWPMGGIDDNPGADAGDRSYYKGLTFSSKAERRVRMFGGFGDFSGTPVFNYDALEMQRPHITAAQVGSLQPLLGDDGTPIEHKYQFIQDGPGERGALRIWAHPQLTRTNYVIGFDTSYGLETGDFDYAVVLDRTTGEQVAEAQGHWGDVGWAQQLEALYWYYGEAFICGERQVGLITLRRLYDEMGIGFMYYDRDEKKRHMRRSDLLGHHRRTGDLVIRKLRVALAPHDQHQRLMPSDIIIRSAELLRQLFKYQFASKKLTVNVEDARDAEVGMGAPTGDHDDGVMALVYANLALAEVEKFDPPAAVYPEGSYGAVLKTPDMLDAEERERKQRVDPFDFGESS